MLGYGRILFLLLLLRGALDRGGGRVAERLGSNLLLASELASALMAPPAWGLREEKEGEE